MAAVDKLYMNDYNAFNLFRIWCIAYKPSLLRDFYKPFITEREWYELKEDEYEYSKEIIEREHQWCDSLEHLREQTRERFGLVTSEEELKDALEYHNNLYAKIQDKKTWIEEFSLPVARFRFSQDKFLKWHCPIKEVREYLEEQCGVKTKWYHRLFFKGKELL